MRHVAELLVGRRAASVLALFNALLLVQGDHEHCAREPAGRRVRRTRLKPRGMRHLLHHQCLTARKCYQSNLPAGVRIPRGLNGGPGGQHG